MTHDIIKTALIITLLLFIMTLSFTILGGANDIINKYDSATIYATGAIHLLIIFSLITIIEYLHHHKGGADND